MTDIAVILITRNEAENLVGALENVRGFASEVWVLDSYSTDDTVGVAIAHGAQVAQRSFRGFGDQWNFALEHLPVRAAWTMKLDPDERLSSNLKASIAEAIAHDQVDGLSVRLSLWFMGRPLQVHQTMLRVWRTGTCRFTDVSVNEHPLVSGRISKASGDLIHLDSIDLHSWFDKQNHYTTAEAFNAVTGAKLGVAPALFRGPLPRRMWLKQNFGRLPFRYAFIQGYCLLVRGAWRSGSVGVTWSRLRADVHRMIGTKILEMRSSGYPYRVPPAAAGEPDLRAIQYD